MLMTRTDVDVTADDELVQNSSKLIKADDENQDRSFKTKELANANVLI